MASEELLRLFVRESNWIEGIRRDPTDEEIAAHEQFLTRERKDLTITSFELFVERIQPGAKLRRYPGLDVCVGSCSPPKGGEVIVQRLQSLIYQAKAHKWAEDLAYILHRDYEILHPFTDGNGRSGRVFWLWIMKGPEKAPLGFLHHWYYQSLQVAS